MKNLATKYLKQISGGCYCYCSTNPFKAYRPYLFVKEVGSDDECVSLCKTSRKLSYFGYSGCPDSLYSSALKNSLLDENSRLIQPNFIVSI